VVRGSWFVVVGFVVRGGWWFVVRGGDDSVFADAAQRASAYIYVPTDPPMGMLELELSSVCAHRISFGNLQVSTLPLNPKP